MAWNITFFVTGQASSVFNVSYQGATTNVFWDKNSTATVGGNNFAGLSLGSGSTAVISCVLINSGTSNVYCGIGAQY